MELRGGCPNPQLSFIVGNGHSLTCPELAGLFCGYMALLGGVCTFGMETLCGQFPSSVGNLSRSRHKTAKGAPSVEGGPPERQTLDKPSLDPSLFAFVFSLMGAFSAKPPLSKHLLSLVSEWSVCVHQGQPRTGASSCGGEQRGTHQGHRDWR